MEINYENDTILDDGTFYGSYDNHKWDGNYKIVEYGRGFDIFEKINNYITEDGMSGGNTRIIDGFAVNLYLNNAYSNRKELIKRDELSSKLTKIADYKRKYIIYKNFSNFFSNDNIKFQLLKDIELLELNFDKINQICEKNGFLFKDRDGEGYYDIFDNKPTISYEELDILLEKSGIINPYGYEKEYIKFLKKELESIKLINK